MKYHVEYHEHIREDIRKMDEQMRERMRRAIEEKLMIAPEAFGKPLRKSLKGYWKLRVGEFRIVFRIKENVITIIIILHRSVVYDKIKK